ncbi:MAG: riboflavin synthase subunit alpha [Fimbriimonadales bacterium]|nr:MAG: riboflavin synthase subunit alpha [Fimbriimonadales bacterium]
MFTGIVEATGVVESIEPHPAGGARLAIRAFPMTTGESLAMNGVCLTVQQAEGDKLYFDAVPETLRRTNLGDLKTGDLVNLERPLTPESRLGGHFVQGHIDTTARLTEIRNEGNARVLKFQLNDASYSRYIVSKGSIAIDGISLTVVDVDEDGFTVWIIPHTWQVTNLQRRRLGERVNIETDILARYVEKLLRLPPVADSE